MNITTGGPHILIFERDQQLATLLTSELQLAGYECHTARTAVEVFDTIARRPIRLVLVHLAQAATARREFWVALDTQRRERNVQVFTFHCANIASYGPLAKDPDERSHTMLADIEVDGMLGIMNLVTAIRSRIAPSNTATMSRFTSHPNYKARLQDVTPADDENTVPQITTPLQAVTNNGKESGLAQLSHMLQEHQELYPPLQEEEVQKQRNRQNAETRQDEQQRDKPWEVSQAFRPSISQVEGNGEEVALNGTPSIPMSISASSLRASPIQDMPAERIVGGQSEPKHFASSTPPNYYHHQAAPTLMSIATPMPPAPMVVETSIVEQVTPAQTQESEFIEHSPVEDIEDMYTDNAPLHEPEPLSEETPQLDVLEAENDTERTLVEERHTFIQGQAQRQAIQPDTETNDIMQSEPTPQQFEPEKGREAPDNSRLLDIVQSLPPMDPPPPSQQAVSGRATRSLASVLLEGHLVPQNRLEAALGIQRMLRRVDMNYQLGEILLMFKLLTPDQLLAASIVSHGLITTQQIIALGRIRQELHSIGLEYDLESLLILFRMLTPEQLREVRASWSG